MNEVNNTKPYQKQLDEVFCSSCGKPIKKEAEICVFCGVRVKLYGARILPIKIGLLAYFYVYSWELLAGIDFMSGKR